MLIDNREYSEPELKSYIKGLQKRIADAENLNGELKKKNVELKKLLKGAVKCIEKLMRERGENFCKFCRNYEEGCDAALAFAEQVGKLLGEEYEYPDSDSAAVEEGEK